MKINIRNLKIAILCLVFGWSTFGVTPMHAEETAHQVGFESSTSFGQDTSSLVDNDYDTYCFFSEGETIHLTTSEEVSGIYVEWYKIPGNWTLQANEESISCEGQYLHEYISLETPASSFTLSVPAGSGITGIECYSNGELPSDVEVWQPSCNRADMLVFSTHADDEILFLGGAIATAIDQGYSVEICYMTNYWNAEIVREHEKLDGLWTLGIRNYPVNGNFEDMYSMDKEVAKQQYDENAVKSWCVEMVRRFEPQVVLTQDFDGEYGHGAHQLLAESVAYAIDNSNDANIFADSVNTYGTWQVKKAYFHFYEQNPITLELEVPLSHYENKTAVQVATEAYDKHVSQHKWNFYVTVDTNDINSPYYNCMYFGLYKSTVGSDTSNSMMEHITSYADQEEAERKAIEASASAEAERIAKEQAQKEEEVTRQRTIRNWIIGILIVLFVLILLVFLLLLKKKRRRKKRRRR